MLLSKHCPHTGVVNFYDASEPHLSIGSITRCGRSVNASGVPCGYTWRLHALDVTESGHARDEMSAEQSVRALLAKVSHVSQVERH